MHDPMREAIKHRRHQGLDLSKILNSDNAHPEAAIDDAKLMGQPGSSAMSPFSPHRDPENDLAPEAKEPKAQGFQEDSNGDGHMAKHGDESPAQRKAVHAKMDHKLQNEEGDRELDNPEHEPLNRGFEQDAFGHENMGMDPTFEKMMSEGHEDSQGRRPRTLGARVRMALQSKKGR